MSLAHAPKTTCPRCLELRPAMLHTCSPTDRWRELEAERDRFKLIAQEMLQKFTHEATTGEPVVRSEWVPIDTRARWREALK